jgi:hypothetical protein
MGIALCTDVLTEKPLQSQGKQRGPKAGRAKTSKMQVQSQDKKCTNAQKAQSITGLC